MKIRITFLFVLTLFLSAVYYLLEYRPSQIRKECEYTIFSKAVLNSTKRKIQANNDYRQCLVKKGIKPESIFVNIE